MKSKFDSWCPNCRQKIFQGDEIEKVNGRWGHAVCPTKTQEPRQRVARKQFTPSPYQQAIFDFVKSGTGHGVVIAVAGSGKTTTIVEALNYTPKDSKVCMVAFNKSIAEELKTRRPDHVMVKTLHGLGYSNLRKSFPKIQVDELKTRKIVESLLPNPPDGAPNDLKAQVRAKQNALRHLTALAKATLVDASDTKALQDLVEHYGVDINGDEEELFKLLPEVLARCLADTHTVDFDDMLWMPIALGLELEKFDWLFVDETQDLNFTQIQFVLGSIKSTGRIIAVGDPKQSIYGFRGADVTAVPRIIETLKAKTLPLSITYRCPKLHVELAQEIVPDLQPRENAPDGLIENISTANFQKLVKPGDMVLCRINAPLVTEAFALIRNGVKAVVRGRDIGQNFQVLIKKLDAPTIEGIEQNISQYRERELNRLFRRNAPESQIEALNDKCDTLLAIVGECDQPSQISEKIETLFSDDVEGVVFSSVHRAKGLEAERVFILKPELLPLAKVKKDWEMEQEMNCKYVALTRSKSELYFVK